MCKLRASNRSHRNGKTGPGSPQGGSPRPAHPRQHPLVPGHHSSQRGNHQRRVVCEIVITVVRHCSFTDRLGNSRIIAPQSSRPRLAARKRGQILDLFLESPQEGALRVPAMGDSGYGSYKAYHLHAPLPIGVPLPHTQWLIRKIWGVYMVPI